MVVDCRESSKYQTNKRPNVPNEPGNSLVNRAVIGSHKFCANICLSALCYRFFHVCMQQTCSLCYTQTTHVQADFTNNNNTNSAPHYMTIIFATSTIFFVYNASASDFVYFPDLIQCESAWMASCSCWMVCSYAFKLVLSVTADTTTVHVLLVPSSFDSSCWYVSSESGSGVLQYWSWGKNFTDLHVSRSVRGF